MSHTILGTAGHIDHGKTALVKALTGIDTDRLKEEKEREITIDLGFAHLNDNIAFVDVPGHERFVKNMVAGVTGIDLALLVIAADDGIMPQTREHLDILRLLNVKKLIVALTKIDLVNPLDRDWIELVKDEINAMLQETNYPDAPIIPVSSVTREGVEDLKTALINEADSMGEEERRLPFRLPVDRSFSMTGFGTVVTGTAATGSLTLKDRVELLPQKKELRLRGLQRHNKQVQRIEAGDRAAINVSNLHKEEIKRGDEIAHTGFFKPSLTINCFLHYLKSAGTILKLRERVRFHCGTVEAIGRVIHLESDKFEPGESAPVQFQLEKPVVAAVGDHFIIRRYSPAVTIGGGEIMEIDTTLMHGRKMRTSAAKYLRDFKSRSLPERVVSFVQRSGLSPLSTQAVVIQFGLFHDQVDDILNNERENVAPLQNEGKPIDNSGKIPLDVPGQPVKSSKTSPELKDDSTYSTKRSLSERYWIDKKSFDSFIRDIVNYIDEYHKLNPEHPNIHRTHLIKNAAPGTNELVWKYALELLAQKKRIKLGKNHIKRYGFVPTFSEEGQNIQENLIALLGEKCAEGPTIEEAGTELNAEVTNIESVVRILVDKGIIILIGNSFLYTSEELKRIEAVIRNLIETKGSFTISEFRKALETSRKYALPLLNYFDDLGVTVRVGDKRVMR